VRSKKPEFQNLASKKPNWQPGNLVESEAQRRVSLIGEVQHE